MQDLGLYNHNKELMTEDDFEKTSLDTWSKRHEKLMKPVEATLEGRGAEGGVPGAVCPTETPCTQYSRLAIQFRSVSGFFVFLAFFRTFPGPPLKFPGPPQTPLDRPAPPPIAPTPLTIMDPPLKALDPPTQRWTALDRPALKSWIC